MIYEYNYKVMNESTIRLRKRRQDGCSTREAKQALELYKKLLERRAAGLNLWDSRIRFGHRWENGIMLQDPDDRSIQVDVAANLRSFFVF